MDSLKFLADNWFVLFAMMCVIAFITVAAVKFMSLPTEKQIANVKEWLKYAVIEAERELGSKTGACKLRMC